MPVGGAFMTRYAEEQEKIAQRLMAPCGLGSVRQLFY